ncbi:MAG: hypothetical protein CMJ89_08090 [Planctomycetes bacterium]|nr:hypothetical protein [Planctomycetota bacterium]
MFRSPCLLSGALCAILFVVSCGEPGSSVVPPGTGGEFSVNGSDVTTPWKLNQPILFRFTRPVDFATVSRRSIRIETSLGVSAEGSYAFLSADDDGDGIPEIDPTQIVFQPRCPLQGDGSDSGLEKGATYLITIATAADSVFETLRSAGGRPLTQTFVRTFGVVAGDSPADLYVDFGSGAPLPLIRDLGSSDPLNTYLEVGGDDRNRVYFEFDSSDGTVNPNPADFLAPLNRFAEPGDRLVFYMWFNQPIDPASSNLDRLVVQYLDARSRWHSLDTVVELLSNCFASGKGALARLTPRGVMPPEGFVRLRIENGFRDLAGQVWVNALDGFADLSTTAVHFESLVPADKLGDEVAEGFDFGAVHLSSREDPQPRGDTGQAVWGQGVLRSSVGFDGTGGPNGDFDWVVQSGENVFFNTTLTVIVGGADGIPEEALEVVDGFLSLRNLIVEEGAMVRVIGPNPLVIEATGSVVIRGLIDASGFNGHDVATLNTGHLPEPGGAGTAGGGDGGVGSPSTNTSSPRGGHGEGPFRLGSRGGMGGESGFAGKAFGKDARRPGGGGGGRFARDQGDLIAEHGGDGHPLGRGAVTGLSPAVGGSPNESVFEDALPGNDFYGVIPRVNVMGEVVGRMRGELDRPWAGHGGGGGGDAVPFDEFPAPNWNPGSDEKGGPGGGGGGLVRIRALGPIHFGPLGEIRVRGGRGGVGENALFLDHVGGTGGSGSGGHVMLESASFVDFQGPRGRDFIDAAGGPHRSGPTGGVPADISNGGQGGPGVVQLHVPRPERGFGASPEQAGVVLPMDALIQDDPLDAVTSPPAVILYPDFGSRSTARSRWISLGAAEQSADGGVELVTFLFKGTEQAAGGDEGKVLVDGDTVRDVDPLFGPGVIDGLDARVEEDGVTLSLRGDALSFGSSQVLFDDVYLRTPALLENFLLRFSTDTGFEADFDVGAAAYDDSQAVLTLQVPFEGPTLADFVATADAPVTYSLIPRFFRLSSRLGLDRLPEGAYVRMLFQGATETAGGLPDEDSPVVDWTGDIRRFNELEPGQLDFFRFSVEFELQAAGVEFDPAAGTIELDFLRVPFRF